MAGIAGALFVPVVGIMSPAALGIVPSLELLIGVAVGGRATLIGAVIGTVLVNYAKTGLSEQFASGWLYLQGAMFILVVAFAPKGLAGIWEALRRSRSTAPASLEETAPEPANVLEAVS
jgi:urea transport system permease protein